MLSIYTHVIGVTHCHKCSVFIQYEKCIKDGKLDICYLVNTSMFLLCDLFNIRSNIHK